MKRSALIILTISLLIGAIVFTGCSSALTRNSENPKGEEYRRGYEIDERHGYKNENRGFYGDIENLPKEDLSEDEIKAMTEAIMDEYKARDFYTLVMEKFGEVNPFVNIKRAEEMHIDALKRLFEKYGLDVPEDMMMDEASKLMEKVNTIEDACKIGVQAEIENKDMYDKLFNMVDNQDIKRVFTSLRDASQNQHLPAFERCSEGNTERGNRGCNCDDEMEKGGRSRGRGRN